MVLIVDTDAGHDDALAMLMLMAFRPDDILCFTAVAGNAVMENVARNISAIKSLAGYPNIPVHTGGDSPLVLELVTAKVHGTSGLDGIDMSEISFDMDGKAPQRIVELAHQYAGELEILTLGPLTNIARALQIDSTISTKIKRIIMMGGAIDVSGNQNRTGEFNICVDPHAADIVFKSSIPKILVPLDPCDEIVIPLHVFEELKGCRIYSQIHSLMEHFIGGINLEIGANGALVYDALAAYYLIKPEAYEVKRMDVVVETKGEHTIGMTVAEKRLVAKKDFNMDVVTGIDSDMFISDMIKLLKSL